MTNHEETGLVLFFQSCSFYLLLREIDVDGDDKSRSYFTALLLMTFSFNSFEKNKSRSDAYGLFKTNPRRVLVALLTRLHCLHFVVGKQLSKLTHIRGRMFEKKETDFADLNATKLFIRIRRAPASGTLL